MSEYRRIYVPLSKEEFAALQDVASKEYRGPRDQARHLLRSALGLAEVRSVPINLQPVTDETLRARIAELESTLVATRDALMRSEQDHMAREMAQSVPVEVASTMRRVLEKAWHEAVQWGTVGDARLAKQREPIDRALQWLDASTPQPEQEAGNDGRTD